MAQFVTVSKPKTQKTQNIRIKAIKGLNARMGLRNPGGTITLRNYLYLSKRVFWALNGTQIMSVLKGGQRNNEII